MTESFSPALLNDFDRFKAYFNPDESLEQIKNLPASAVVRPGFWYRTMQVVWIIATLQFATVFAVFFRGIAILIGALGFKKLSCSLKIRADNIVARMNYLINLPLYGKRLLVLARNGHQIRNSEIYGQPSMAPHEITDPEVKSIARGGTIDFYSSGGLCYGASNWFNYLFNQILKRKDLAKQYPSLQSKLMATAHLFKDGVPKQGALLQALCAKQGKLFDSDYREQARISSYALTHSPEKVRNTLSKLPDGTYGIVMAYGLGGHLVSYIKSGSEHFIFDPNFGLVIIENLTQLQQELKFRNSFLMNSLRGFAGDCYSFVFEKRFHIEISSDHRDESAQRIDSLNDFDRFKAQFDPKESLETIKNLPESAAVRPTNGAYFGKMQVVWIIATAPFAYIFSVFLHAIAHLLGTFSLTFLSRYLYITASNMRQGLENYFAQVKYGKRFLAPACNRHLVSNSEIYRLPSVNREAFLNPKIQSVVLREKIDFFRPQGLCRGAIVWFNHLFDQMRQREDLVQQYPSLESKLLAIAHLFKEGVPRQGALLHVFKADEGALLGYNWAKEASFTPQELTHSCGAVKKQLDGIQDGTYAIFFQEHGVSYFKQGAKQYIWDPNSGLITIENTLQLLEELQSRATGEVVIVRKLSQTEAAIRTSG
ncbi:MAG: hypothetical protein KR126chlam1_01346 [Chlamydiae bacterium]|nr:hypothetical protein [Chlamydiota bacterium]